MIEPLIHFTMTISGRRISKENGGGTSLTFPDP
jgi:hypothetical protein